MNFENLANRYTVSLLAVMWVMFIAYQLVVGPAMTDFIVVKSRVVTFEDYECQWFGDFYSDDCLHPDHELADQLESNVNNGMLIVFVPFLLLFFALVILSFNKVNKDGKRINHTEPADKCHSDCVECNIPAVYISL